MITLSVFKFNTTWTNFKLKDPLWNIYWQLKSNVKALISQEFVNAYSLIAES